VFCQCEAFKQNTADCCKDILQLEKYFLKCFYRIMIEYVSFTLYVCKNCVQMIDDSSLSLHLN